MRKLWPGLLLVLIDLVFGLWVLRRLPDRVATHWDASGTANGWSSPLLAVFFIPVIALVMAVVLVYAPRVDPRRANFVKHAGAYWLIGNLILGFIAVIHIVALGVNLGWAVDLTQITGLGLGLLFVCMGSVFSKIQPNWMFGIRTPWTLSSERSWQETHRYGGFAFMGAGALIVLTSAFWPRAFVYVLIGTMTVATIFSVVVSYVVWKRDPEAGGAH